MANNSSLLLEAKDRLDRCVVEHTRFDDAKKQILRHLRFPSDKKIVFVIGPSGVGKTTLAAKIANMICKDPVLRAKIDADPGCIPSVSIEVPSIANNGRFAWSSFYHDYLDKLDCPLPPTERSLPPLPVFRHGITPEEKVLRAIKHRRPLITLLDEGNHFSDVASGKALLEQGTRIKSFVNRSGVLHVVFGTYELAALTNLSEQLARRCEIIHFGRYRATQSDLAAFGKVVGNFQHTADVVHHIDLRTMVKYLHEGTIGCVGTLKGWIVDALGLADANGRKKITFEDLEETKPKLKALETMLLKAMEGEATLRESSQLDLDRYLYHLGHTSEPPAQQGKQTVLWPEPDEPKKSGGGKQITKPFQQTPVRRPVGLGRQDTPELIAS